MSELYKLLDQAKRQIRLLRVGQEIGLGTKTIGHEFPECDLAVFSLNDSPRYKALSYCWGNEHADHRIKINGISFLVRKNLHSFLAHFLAGQRKGHDVTREYTSWIFIDAICINQQDLDERSSQVTLMGDVYRKADEVIVWLGDEGDPLNDFEPTTMVAHTFHKDLAAWQENFDQIHVVLLMDAANRICGSTKNALNGVLESLGINPAQALVVPLVHRPFWSRLWVVQEMILASSLTFWYKSLRVPWTVLYELLEYGWAALLKIVDSGRFLREADPKAFFNERTDARHERHSIEALLLLRGKIKYAEQARRHQMPLHSAVTTFFGRQSSDARDQVYGYLGMTESKVPVNYTVEGTSGLYGQALIEGLLEIAYRYTYEKHKPGERNRESAEFTVSLARALGMDIHDEYAACYQMTRYCLELSGLPFQPTSELWARVHRLNMRRLLKFGNLGRKLYKQVPKLLHSTESLKSSFYGRDKDVERICKELKDGFMILRCFPRWRIQQIRLTIPDLPLTTDTKLAEDLIEMIGSFPDCSKSIELATEAVDVLQKHFNELQDSADRIDQDHARRLEHYIEALNRRASERTVENCDFVEENEAATETHERTSTKHDERIIVQSMMDTNFSGKLSEMYLSAPESEAVKTVMLRKYEMILYSHSHIQRYRRHKGTRRNEDAR